MRDGREIPLQAVIQAIASPISGSMDMDNTASLDQGASAPAAAPRSGGALGGVNATANSVGSTTAAAAGNLGGSAASTANGVTSQTGAATNGSLDSAASSTLNATSTGVIGLKGLQLDAVAANSTQGSVVRSTSDNVRLESGTRLVLRLVSQ
jgi:hypothetical protein